MTPFLLHLLRHGAPERVGLMLGRTDCPPIVGGIRACVERAGSLAVEAVVGSDLSRAARAAEAVGDALGLTATTDPRWREIDFGDWDGLAPHAIDTAALSLFWQDPDANPPPGGERWSALVARIAGAIADLPARDTLVVTHGGAMRAALAHLCGLDHRAAWAFDLPYAALLTLRVWPGDPLSAQIAGLRT